MTGNVFHSPPAKIVSFRTKFVEYGLNWHTLKAILVMSQIPVIRAGKGHQVLLDEQSAALLDSAVARYRDLMAEFDEVAVA